jgi:putative phosphoesterase
VRRIGLIGDTQGRYKVDALLAEVKRRFEGVDEVWHAGDWQDPKVLEGLAEIAPVTTVNGNAPDDPRYPERVKRKVERLNIGMVHRPPRPSDPWLADLDICIHGHTHRWRDEVLNGTRLINVSTPTAAGFSQDRTIAVLTVDGREAQLLKITL